MPIRGRFVTAIILRMPNRKRSSLNARLEQMSTAVTRWTGSTQAFAVALLSIVVWATAGPLFRFSDTWQLVINTGTNLVTFLMVFLIQRSQNKDSLAIHLKLNELVAAVHGASNRLIDVEALTESELVRLHKYYAHLSKMAKRDLDLGQSHSVE